MENERVRDAITGEIEKLAKLMLGNPGCHLEVNKRDGNQWKLYKEKPDWGKVPSGEEKEEIARVEEYVKSITLATSANDFDFPGISGVDDIDPVLYEAMAAALGITLAPEE